MKLFAPAPRLKLYTYLSDYFLIFISFIFLRVNKGSNLNKLAEKFKILTQKKYCIPVPMARVGIYLTIKSLIKKNKNEVILSPYTIADVINMVVASGGIPIFADIDSNTCNIDPKNIENLINKKTSLVLITHFYGQVCDIAQITKICDKYKIPFVEDAAQALGAKYQNRMAGSFGIAGIYSFGMYKNINSFYGGMIVTNSKYIFDSVTMTMKDWPTQDLLIYLKKVISGITTDFVTNKYFFSIFFFRFFRWAFLNKINIINNKLKIDVNPVLQKKIPNSYKVKMSDLQAKLVLGQLGNLEKNTYKRIELGRIWFNELKDIKQIIIPRYVDDLSHMFWYFPIQYKYRNDLVSYILKKGYDISESYHRNCSSLQCFKDYKKNCAKAQNTSDSLIYLPTYPGYLKDDAIKIARLIKSYFEK